jgi:hypothetical protein
MAAAPPLPYLPCPILHHTAVIYPEVVALVDRWIILQPCATAGSRREE